ncbi:hypothetical protein BJ138DRAFT_1168176, partial [Hygrophoropsis aurantiaca]
MALWRYLNIDHKNHTPPSTIIQSPNSIFPGKTKRPQMRAVLRASAITVAILCTLSSVTRTSAKCVHSNPFALSLAIYESKHCETHDTDDHHVYELEKHPLSEKWDEHGCQCLNFIDWMLEGTCSLVFTPGRHGGWMHLLLDADCSPPYETDDDDGEEDSSTCKQGVGRRIGGGGSVSRGRAYSWGRCGRWSAPLTGI